MVCSACGFENLSGMRFCGMCGTPLPHRPLTTPGAQSTLSLTRVPLEGGVSSPGRGTSTVSSRTAVSPEMPAADGGSSSPEGMAPWGADDPAMDAEDVMPPATSDQPPTELVPDIPLEQYLQNFHYEPPSEPTEMGMRGDASAEEQGTSAQNTTVARAVPVELTTRVDAAASETESPAIIEEVPADTVEGRLGLEAEEAEAFPIERPNFLDLGEAREEREPATSGTSFITGPSFLGLNDPPPAVDSRLPKPRKLRKSHWRAWSAVAVILVFAGLGVMEWRAQVQQTNDGPVEIVKTRVRDWKQRLGSQSVSEPAPASSGDASSKPDIQVQPQNQNGSANRPASSSKAPMAPLVPASDQPAPLAQTQTHLPHPAANDNLNSPAPADTAQTAAQKPKPPRQTDVSTQEAVAKPGVPGAEEMAKAKNASDAVATAAWLWKATAKGNPDAPVQLADMYISGQGVPRSCEQAMVLLRTAAEKENAHARNRLASMYATGSCVQRDRVQAYRWLSSALSANPNSDWAKQNRDLIWQQMTPDERAQAEKYR
ncbi:MAG: hypothetical protein ACLP3R_08570 [Candidatus Korobacteraceae bacterium]